MISLDTETTGIHLHNGCTTFSIGVYDGTKFKHSTVNIDPVYRRRTQEFPQSLRRIIESSDCITCHNAHFDIKALCEAGILSWDEPNDPTFWQRILDTTTLAHLHCSTDELTLDSLTRKYLGRNYAEEDLLVKTVNLCRTAARKHRPDWDIASADGNHPSFKACGSNTKWNRMDYWLPAAVRKGIPASLRPNLPDDLLSRVCLQYLKADCINTYELAQFYCHALTERHDSKIEQLLQINKQVEHVTWKMESTGVYVHAAETDAAIQTCDYFINLLTERVHTLSGMDSLTDAQLRILLFNIWELDPVSQTNGGQPSVNAATILHLHGTTDPASRVHQFLSCLLSLRKYEKKRQSLTSYRNSRTSSGHVHPSFNSTGTRTTRFSSKNPNAQNVTKAGNPYEDDAPDIARWLKRSPSMRSCFGPPPGMWWLTADYSQLQLRIFAHVTNEQEMKDAFNRGWDAHDFVARRIFQIRDSDSPTKAQRRIAKNVNFAFIFGASPRKLEKTAGVPGLWDTVTKLFPNAHAFIEETKKTINQTGEVTCLGGYPLALKDYLNKYTGRVEKAAHAGVNYIVQGNEGIIVKRAMRLCDDYFTSEYPEGRIALQVHDEVIFEVPARLPKRHVRNLKSLMEQAAAGYGIHAPAEVALVTHRWDRELKVSL